jgi:Xaa-Pro aminopeptidase
LVEPTLLDEAETRWLDAYHARLRKELGPLLDTASRAWLERSTQPLSRG